MRLVIISDTHGFHNELGQLPEGDVLIHCGDATMSGTRGQTLDFLNWYGARKGYRAKLFVPGNHDFYFQDDASVAEVFCIERGIKLLVDRPFALSVKGTGGQESVKFYGSPWVPNLENWAYYADHGQLVHNFSRIPSDTDVLITHGPPWGILDRGPAGEAFHIGSKELAERIHSLNLRAHCFGHIHHGYGVEDHGAGRYSVNACSCNEAYECVNPPIVLDI